MTELTIDKALKQAIEAHRAGQVQAQIVCILLF